ILAAQRRGVLMEVGNGRVNFNFSVAKAAMQCGLFPNIISSDATLSTYHKDRAMWDLTFVMSKFMSLGMPLTDVLRAVTVTPAKQLGLSGRLGVLVEGRDADVVLCRMDNDTVEFRDSDGNTLIGPRGIVPTTVFRCGEIVYQESSD
ncbi:amidohydrolase family protein, partial [Oscillibacter sp.]|uniref:amidohydrolase family protein n=1 Tax=Oscillibacter sp. TaxID=1945593 RepID=UPI0028B1D17B